MASSSPHIHPHLFAKLNQAAEALWEPLGHMWQAHTRPHGFGPSDHTQSGMVLDVLAEVDSTNTALMRRAREGDTSPALMVALTQTAGRGRMGKDWHSAPGSSLTFSMSLPLCPTNWSGLSLAVGVGVVEGLLALHQATATPHCASPPLQLKWPNDVWVNQTKLAGILVETAHTGTTRQVVVGVGINVLPMPVNPTAVPVHGLAPVPPAAWADWSPGTDAADVLRSVAPALLRALLQFELGGFAAFQSRFAQLDALSGLPVVLSDGSSGMARGVNAMGELLMEGPQGVRALHSADVSIRPRHMLAGTPC